MAEYFLNPQKYDDSALDEKLQNELDQYEFNPLMNQFFLLFSELNIQIQPSAWIIFQCISNKKKEIYKTFKTIYGNEFKNRENYKKTNVDDIISEIEFEIKNMKLVTKEFENENSFDNIFTKE